MDSNELATELINKFGKHAALEIANMIFKEHYQYANPQYIWRGEFRETYTNVEKCNYWNNVRQAIELRTEQYGIVN